MSISNREKALIGAVGGLSLAMLKLIEAKFYVHEGFSSNEAVTAYLTYCCFVFLGIVAAIFLSEQEGSDDKIKKNTFILGLLAPSLLIALVNQPIGGSQSAERAPVSPAHLSDIPILGSAVHSLLDTLIPTALAQSQAPGQASRQDSRYTVIRPEEVQSGFSENVLRALGRYSDRKRFIYVVGATENLKVAINHKQQLEQLIRRYGTRDGKKILPEVTIVQPEGSQQLYLTLDHLQTSQQAAAIQRLAWTVGRKALISDDKASQESAKLLLEGRILDGAAFFKN